MTSPLRSSGTAQFVSPPSVPVLFALAQPVSARSGVLRRLWLVLAGCLVLTCPVSAQERTVRLTTTVTVHALAREDAEVRATLAPGTDVVLGSAVGEWTAIRGPGDVHGWVRTASLSPASSTAVGGSTSIPAKAPGDAVPSPQAPGRTLAGDQAPGPASPPSGHGFYHTMRSIGLSLQSQGDVDALSFSQARLAGSWAEIGYTLTGERSPGTDGDSYFVSLSGNFRVFPVQPSAERPLGIVLEAVASTGRSLDEDAEGSLAGVGGHAGLFARIATGGAILIPRAGWQVTRIIPVPDSDPAFNVTQWYAGGELQLGAVIPNAFIGRHESLSFVALGVTIAY